MFGEILLTGFDSMILPKCKLAYGGKVEDLTPPTQPVSSWECFKMICEV